MAAVPSQSQLFVASNRLGGKKKEQLSCFPLLLSLCECNSLQNSEKKHNEQLHLFFLQQSYLRANIPCWLSLQRLYMCVYICVYIRHPQPISCCIRGLLCYWF